MEETDTFFFFAVLRSIYFDGKYCVKIIIHVFVRDRAPGLFLWMLGQTHLNGWSRIIASQNGGSTSYIFSL